MKLNDQQLATVLAALRHWQNTVYFRVGKQWKLRTPTPLVDHFDGTLALTPVEIDHLCESLNTDDWAEQNRMRVALAGIASKWRESDPEPEVEGYEENDADSAYANGYDRAMYVCAKEAREALSSTLTIEEQLVRANQELAALLKCGAYVRRHDDGTLTVVVERGVNLHE